MILCLGSLSFSTPISHRILELPIDLMIAQEQCTAIRELDLRGVRLDIPYNFIIIVLSAETELCLVVHFIISLRKLPPLLVGQPSLGQILQ